MRDDEHRELARGGAVVDVGRGRQRGERAIAAADERELTEALGQLRKRGPPLVEPGGHRARLAARDLGAAAAAARSNGGGRARGPRRRTARIRAARRRAGGRRRAAAPSAAPRSASGRLRLASRTRASSRAGSAGAGSAQKPRAQLPLRLSLRAARRTGLEVRGQLRRQPLRQLPVHEAGDALGIAGHADPFGLSASRSSARPRWMRDITVPTGTPSASAISA